MHSENHWIQIKITPSHIHPTSSFNTLTQFIIQPRVLINEKLHLPIRKRERNHAHRPARVRNQRRSAVIRDFPSDQFDQPRAQLILRRICLQGLCVRGEGPDDAQAYVPRVPLRHTGPDDRQHAARHLQEDNDRALATPEPGQARRRQRPGRPRRQADESAHGAQALPQERTATRQ